MLCLQGGDGLHVPAIQLPQDLLRQLQLCLHIGHPQHNICLLGISSGGQAVWYAASSVPVPRFTSEWHTLSCACAVSGILTVSAKQ